MIKQFYKFQSYFENKNVVLKKITYRVMLYIIRIYVPMYYLISSSKLEKLKNDSDNNTKVIISLTTFPPRMKNIWMVLESLFRQEEKPDKIILWLASSQFPSEELIDKRVLDMRKRGLEIRFCDDLRSHKKYYYTMQEYKNDIVITVDDDIYYPENLIKELLVKHKKHPKSIVCYRAHKITLTEDNLIKDYKEWDHGANNYEGPDQLLMATGCGGVLYPPNCLDSEVFNVKAIKELSPDADDIWLKCMSILKGTTTVKVHPSYTNMFSTPGSSESGLAKTNVIEGHNDIQLRKIIRRYKIDFRKKP